jgi:hypothetical protein
LILIYLSEGFVTHFINLPYYSLPKDYPVASQNWSLSTFSPGYTPGASSYQSSVDDTFIKGHPIMSIAEMKKLKTVS